MYEMHKINKIFRNEQTFHAKTFVNVHYYLILQQKIMM